MAELLYLSTGVHWSLAKSSCMSDIKLTNLNELARFQTVYDIASLAQCQKGRLILKQVHGNILSLPSPYQRGSTKNEKKKLIIHL